MIKDVLNRLIRKENISAAEAKQVMVMIMEGEATSAQIGSLLTALRMKGETTAEILGCAQAMRDKAQKIRSKHKNVIDTCGTGGDCSGTFNISTTAAFVVSAGGVPVAKHGNRSVSSKSGSADVLEALGVNIDLDARSAQKLLDDIGITFLFAPVFHQAMKYAIAPRNEIGFRSIFNLLGPLTNPAEANVQLLGVPFPQMTEPLAEVLDQLGVERACVVHGAGGLDEASTVGLTKVSALKNGTIKTYFIDASEFGFPKVSIKELFGGNAIKNAQITREILEGKKGPCRDIVIFNSALAFLTSGEVQDISEGILVATDSIDTGKALGKLEELIEASNRCRLQEVI